MIELKFTDDGTGVYVLMSGTVNKEEIMGYKTTLYECEQFPSLCYLVAIINKVEKLDVSMDECKAIAFYDAEQLQGKPRLRIAVVANDDTIFGMNHTWASYLEGQLHAQDFAARVFRELAEAQRWLADFLGSQEIFYHKFAQ